MQALVCRGGAGGRRVPAGLGLLTGIGEGRE